MVGVKGRSMFSRIAVACFALYCVHGAQNSARDVSALAEQGSAMAREASAQAPRAALQFCLENQSVCSQATQAVAGAATPAMPGAQAHHEARVVEGYPLPPRRPVPHKKA